VAAELFFSFIIATFATMILIPPLGRLAEAWHLVDMPGGRKVHATPVPRLGGLAMAAGAVLPTVMSGSTDPRLAALLAGIAVILAFGVWDDVRGLPYPAKFLGQLAAVLIVVLYGGVRIRYLPFLGLDRLPDAVSIPLSVVALVGITNAVNLADGLDGLAGGIVLLSLGITGILAYPSGDVELMVATASVMGSIVGFLRFNTYPARIFMGDGGSQLLGFSAGVLVLMLTQQSNTALAAALPVMILGLPILDTAMVIGERVYERRSPFLPDKNHIHHKLLTLGLHHYEAVFAIYLLQTALVGAAYFLRFENDWLILSLYAAFCVALIGSLKLAIASGWRFHGRPSQATTPFVPAWVVWLRDGQRPLRIAFSFAAVAIPCYAFFGVLFAERVPGDVGALAWALLAVLLALYASRRHKPFNIVERACAYIAAICVVYLVQVMPGSRPAFAVWRDVLFAAMAIAVAIGFRFSKERFRVTPMDFLVVLVALVVPNLPDVRRAIGSSGMSVAMLIVLFYSIELVLNHFGRRWDVVRFATYATLAMIGLRGAIGALA
jgi:UDP-GlcNAc:undecaprenyl-phosphate GlcNAc-1-phosphate transferase